MTHGHVHGDNRDRRDGLKDNAPRGPPGSDAPVSAASDLVTGGRELQKRLWSRQRAILDACLYLIHGLSPENRHLMAWLWLCRTAHRAAGQGAAAWAGVSFPAVGDFTLNHHTARPPPQRSTRNLSGNHGMEVGKRNRNLPQYKSKF